jgi:hypothetical protein
MAKDSNVSQAGGGFSASGITRSTAGISGRAGRNVTPTYRNGGNVSISENVKIVGAKSPSGKVSLRGGAAQVFGESLKNISKK